jgi:lipid II:glycine glycyltransferase (peptidoglycan interpeptide bridge formation enzyme)
MDKKWRYELRQSEKNTLEVLEGSSEELFQVFLGLFDTMVQRKKFDVRRDPRQFQALQPKLPEALKMRIFVARSEGKPCAGAVIAQHGALASYLFGATNDLGLEMRAAYLLQWRILGFLQQQGTRVYDLSGINPATNHGTYLFKKNLAGKYGRDVHPIGKYDAYPGPLNRELLQLRERLRNWLGSLRR